MKEAVREKAESALAGFEKRGAAMLEALAGKPLKAEPVQPPYEPGRPRLARGYSYSIINFAMKVFLLREKQFYAAANNALQENFRFYLGDKVMRDDRDSFYWSSDLLCRILEFFGEAGSRQPGLLTPETEALCHEMLYAWARNNSRLAAAETEKSRTWHVPESENHHIMRFSAAWHISKLLAAQPEYARLAYDDGGLPAEHFAAWTAYAKRYLQERARKSLFIETGNDFYGLHTIKGIYDFYDFTEDETLRRLAGNLLDLFWACWAQEQLGGVRGGGKARIYPGKFSLKGDDPVRGLAWLYLGVGEMRLPRENELDMLTSGYRLPRVAAEIALDEAGRGRYEIEQRPLGLAKDGYYLPYPEYRAETEWGGILRYAYCTPNFILGTLMTPALPAKDWMLISSQNRWQGAVFSGDPDCRIVPQCLCVDTENPEIQVNRAYNQHWSVQKEGTLITQKLHTSEGAGTMRVWFPRAGLSAPLERGGWIFAETGGAYAAVCIVRGGWETAREPGLEGVWFVCRDEYTPVILEIAEKSDFSDFEEFQRAAAANRPEISGGLLNYRSLSGRNFRFDLSQQSLPCVDGVPALKRIPEAFRSPFVCSRWNSDTVFLRWNGEEKILSFAD
jgi:hypothetical protein